jgi:hypothetical protein
MRWKPTMFSLSESASGGGTEIQATIFADRTINHYPMARSRHAIGEVDAPEGLRLRQRSDAITSRGSSRASSSESVTSIPLIQRDFPL